METKESGQVLERFLKEYLEKHQIPSGARILVGFSGGPDSCALLLCLKAAGEERKFSLGAVYVDHGIRVEQEGSRDREFAKAFFGNLGVEGYIRHLGEGSVSALALETGSGIEAAARQLRYACFDSVMEEGGFDFLALGHTSSDQMETILMRFFSGSGESGLKGIPEKSGRIIRPLIKGYREDIIAYLRRREVEYMSDSTNESSLYLRNRVRNELLPLAEKIFPGYRKALDALREKMEGIDSYMKKQAEKALSWRTTENGLVCGASAFFQEDPAVRLRLLYEGADKLSPGMRFPYRLLRQAAVMQQNRKKTLFEGAGTRLRREGDELFFDRILVRDLKKGYFFVIEGYGSYGIGGSPRFAVRSGENKGSSRIPDAFPFIIRSKRSSDTLAIHEGEKRVSEILSEWGTDSSIRNLIPILQDSSGILGIFGKFWGFIDRYALREAAKEPSGPGLYLDTLQRGDSHGF